LNVQGASVRVVKAATLAEIGALSTVVSTNAQCTAVLQGHLAPVVTMDFDPRGPFLATGGLDHAIRVWRIDAQNARQENAFSDPRLGEIRVLSFMPASDEVLIGASGMGGRVWRWRWRVGNSEEMKSLEHSAAASVLAISSDGKYIAAADGSQVQIWSVNGGSISWQENLKGRGCEITSMAFSRNGEQLLAADVRGRVFSWRGGRRSYRPDSTFVAHTAAVTCSAMSRHGRRLATAGTDNTVRIWTGTDEFDEVAAITGGLRGIVRRLHFSPDGRALMTVSDAGQVAGWNSSNGDGLADWRLNQPVSTGFAIAADSTMVALARTDSAVNLFQIPAPLPAIADAAVIGSR
jgi:WD40 repeat protein